MRKNILLLVLSLLFCGFAAPTVSAQEGLGILNSDLDGALPKALWRDQPRSEIIFLLKNLPANAPLRSMQEIKRDMLLSTYDTKLIKNDIKPEENSPDLLVLRLQKLIEMGLWEDAFKLYTKTTQDPEQNNELAQAGVMLIFYQKGLSTACLEEKVLASRYPNIQFWEIMDAVCDKEIGTDAVIDTQFSESPVIQAIYNDPDFKVSANSIEALNKLTPLELALLSFKGRIDYEEVNLKGGIPPKLIKTFLQDSKFPEKSKESLEIIARQQGLFPESPLTDDAQKQLNNVENISQNALIPLIAKQLKLGQKIEAKTIERLSALAPENKENYFYLQILNRLNIVDDDSEVSKDNLEAGLQALSTRNSEKVNFLKTLLDKPDEFSNNPDNVYEKQIGLTPDGDYVMPTGGLVKWLEKTKKHQFAGLSLLIILSNIEVDAQAENSGDNLEQTTFNMLNSLRTVGLIDQSHHIAKEELANLMVM